MITENLQEEGRGTYTCMYIGTLFVCDPRRIYTYRKRAGVREGGSVL